VAPSTITAAYHALIDGLGPKVYRYASVTVDGPSYLAGPQGRLYTALEANLRPLSGATGGPLRRTDFPGGRIGGKLGREYYNARWFMGTGMQRGFTVLLRHGKNNLREVRVTAHPTFPMTKVVAFAAGAIFGFLWAAYFLLHYDDIRSSNVLWGMILFGIGITSVMLYMLFTVATNTVYIGFLVPIGCVLAASSLVPVWGGVIAWLITYALISRVEGKAMEKRLMTDLGNAVDAAFASLPELRVFATPTTPEGIAAAQLGAKKTAAAVPDEKGPAAYTPQRGGGMMGMGRTVDTPKPVYTTPLQYRQAPKRTVQCTTCGYTVEWGEPKCPSCKTRFAWQ
jgi:hypothetical protein